MLDQKKDFLRFIRRALAWRPEDRPTTKELLQDPWWTVVQYIAYGTMSVKDNLYYYV